GGPCRRAPPRSEDGPWLDGRAVGAVGAVRQNREAIRGLELERGGQGELLTAAALPRPPDRHGGLAACDEACRRPESSRARDELARDVAGLALQLARRDIGSIAQASGGRRRRIGDE